MSKSQFRSQ